MSHPTHTGIAPHRLATAGSASGLEIASLQLAAEHGQPLVQIAQWLMQPGLHWVYGASGAGKTRLLRCLAGRAEHAEAMAASANASGVYWHDPEGQPRTLSPSEVFFADPDWPQWDAMTLQEVHASLRTSSNAGCGFLSAASTARREAALLEGFGLTPHLHKSMFMLSTGTRRKVFLMAALLAPQPLVLLDEPSAALDLRSIHTLYDALAVRNRLAGHVTIVATAIEHPEHGQAGRGHWALERP